MKIKVIDFLSYNLSHSFTYKSLKIMGKIYPKPPEIDLKYFLLSVFSSKMSSEYLFLTVFFLFSKIKQLHAYAFQLQLILFGVKYKNITKFMHVQNHGDICTEVKNVSQPIYLSTFHLNMKAKNLEQLTLPHP